jgi:hypothetical protein
VIILWSFLPFYSDAMTPAIASARSTGFAGTAKLVQRLQLQLHEGSPNLVHAIKPAAVSREAVPNQQDPMADAGTRDGSRARALAIGNRTARRERDYER